MGAIRLSGLPDPGAFNRSNPPLRNSVLNRYSETLLASIARDGGLDQYKYLMDAFRRTDTTRDIQFQRTYRS